MRNLATGGEHVTSGNGPQHCAALVTRSRYYSKVELITPRRRGLAYEYNVKAIKYKINCNINEHCDNLPRKEYWRNSKNTILSGMSKFLGRLAQIKPREVEIK